MSSHESNISYYNTLKSLHKCVRCRQQDARTLIGKPLCFDCLELKREEMKGRDESESNKRSHEKAVNNGICTTCHKRVPDSGYKTCKYCRTKMKERRDAKRVEQNKLSHTEAKAKNICGICYKNPKMLGYNTCPECYEYTVNKLKGTQSVNRIKNRISKELRLKEMYSSE